MCSRRKWQETDVESALNEVKRGAVLITGLGMLVISTKYPRAVFAGEKERVWKNLPSCIQQEKNKSSPEKQKNRWMIAFKSYAKMVSVRRLMKFGN